MQKTSVKPAAWKMLLFFFFIIIMLFKAVFPLPPFPDDLQQTSSSALASR